MKNVLKPLAKSISISLKSTAAASVGDAEIHKKVNVSGKTNLVISNKEVEHIIKIVKSFEDSGLLIKGATKTFENETTEQSGGFIETLLVTLDTGSLGNMLAGK